MPIKIEMIPCVDAADFPEGVEDYCIEHEFSTHYQNDIVQVEDDGNVFAEWLKEQGVDFTKAQDEGWIAVGIFAT